MATQPNSEIPIPPSRRTTLCPPRTKALAKEKLWPSANQGSWVLKKKIFRAKRLIELRSINSWRDMLGSVFLIHQYQMPKACPILNFLLGDLPSCQIQLLNTLNPGRVYKEQTWNNIYFASPDGQKSSQHGMLRRKSPRGNSQKQTHKTMPCMPNSAVQHGRVGVMWSYFKHQREQSSLCSPSMDLYFTGHVLVKPCGLPCLRLR